MGKLFGILMKFIPAVVGIGLVSYALTACDDANNSLGTMDPELGTPGEKNRLILIYAIAANNLESAFRSDTTEIKRAADQLNLESNAVLVYSVTTSNRCLLSELKSDGKGGYKYEIVEEFSELPLSTSGQRISEVMDYVIAKYDYPYKGLVLWSHADGWVPWFGGDTPNSNRKNSFGWDTYPKYPGGTVYKTDITTLSEAIPQGQFDFIWFDCCYMANIETIYQLREKANYIVGSVIETGSAGMPYDLTMPHLIRRNPDLEGAAQVFFDWYDDKGMPVSISVVDTRGLESLAEVSNDIFEKYEGPSDLNHIQNYCILYDNGKRLYFYDMQQLLESYGPSDSLIDRINQSFEKTVIYKASTPYNWTNNYVTKREPINLSRFSGLSMHNYENNGSASEKFYETLDWYKSTR